MSICVLCLDVLLGFVRIVFEPVFYTQIPSLIDS